MPILFLGTACPNLLPYIVMHPFIRFFSCFLLGLTDIRFTRKQLRYSRQCLKQAVAFIPSYPLNPSLSSFCGRLWVLSYMFDWLESYRLSSSISFIQQSKLRGSSPCSSQQPLLQQRSSSVSPSSAGDWLQSRIFLDIQSSRDMPFTKGSAAPSFLAHYSSIKFMPYNLAQQNEPFIQLNLTILDQPNESTAHPFICTAAPLVTLIR